MRPVDAIEPRHVAPHHVGRRRRDQEAERRGDAGAKRHHDPLDLEQPGEIPGMHRSGAAEGDDRVLARIASLLGQMHARGRGHRFVDDPLHAERRLVRL